MNNKSTVFRDLLKYTSKSLSSDLQKTVGFIPIRLTVSLVMDKIGLGITF